MTTDQERLYMQYFYNSVIEFVYFIILYIESFGKANLDNIGKYVKFFKVEVDTFILSFDGITFRDKLCQMLNTLDCFILMDGSVCLNKNTSVKDSLFEDLVISKCVDLVLRGINNIDAICENLNFNNVIHVNKENILDITEKSSYFSTENKQTVVLHHIHGLLGFEDDISKLVVCYFCDILYCDKILSFNEVRNHSKFLSFCGVRNLIMIFSILNCSKQFDCENGFIWLKKKSKKSPKLKSLHMEQHESKFSSRSLPVGQIVYSTYGSSLYKWSGEIGSLNESSGVIYCVVDFTNGYQGVFNIYFNETALKVVSETGNLKKCLNIRDLVEFDAQYYSGRNFDRCWQATRLKLLHNKKFEYNEHLYGKVCCESEILKNQCVNNKCCLDDISSDFIHDKSLKILSIKYDAKEKKIMKTSGCEHVGINNSVNKYEGKNFVTNQKSTGDLHLSLSNIFTVNYSFMFGKIYMVMADKGVALAKQGGKLYNVFFMKSSVYLPDKFKDLTNDQKVLVLIPYHESLESFCVSTLVYGLNDKETCETEKSDVRPEDFAVQVFVENLAENLKCTFCNNCSFLNGIISKEEDFAIDLKQRMELIELYKFILKEYKVPFQNDYLLKFLFGLYKINFEENFSKKVFHFIVKLSKYLKKHARKPKVKFERKIRVENPVNNYNLIVANEVQDLCASVSALSLEEKNSVSNSNLSPKSKSLDVLRDCRGTYLSPKSKSLDILRYCVSTLTSFETCSSSDSNESFYSCESNYSPKSSSSLLNENNCVMIPEDDLLNEPKVDSKLNHAKKHRSKPNRKVFHLSSRSHQEFSFRPQGKNLKQKLQYINHSKYLCLKSVPRLKHSVNKKRRIVQPAMLKSLCRNCFKSSVKVAAYISMISKSFFFYTLNINGCDVTLPLLKQAVPPDLQGNMKLNTYSEITVIPNVLANLSHIIAADIFT